MCRTQGKPIRIVEPFGEMREPLLKTAFGNSAQHGIGEASDSLPDCGGSQINRCCDGCLDRDPHGQDLMRPEPQQIDYGWLEVIQRSATGGGDDHVVAALPAACACEQFGREGRIAASQATLGRRSCIDRSDVVAALNELEGDGYVERSPDPTDARRNIITITTAGKRHYKRLTNLVGKAQEEIFAPLSATDRARLTTILTKLLGYHQDL